MLPLSLTTRLALIGATGAILVSLGGVAWWSYSSVRSERDQLLVEKGQLTEQAKGLTKERDAAVTNAREWALAFNNQQATLDRLSRVNEQSAQERKKLDETFAQHDLGTLAARKPGLVAPRLNRGTDDALRVLRDSSRVGQPASAPEGRPTP